MNDATFYVAAPPQRLRRLPLSVRLSMEREQCAVCDCEVWVESHSFLEAAMKAADEIVILCEACAERGTAAHVGPVSVRLATPKNWRKHFIDANQN